MLNVNYGRNEKLLEECRPLAEYAWLVNEVRKAKNEEELEGIIDAAITKMPADFVIKPFLEEHRAEVKGMLLTEYDEVATMELFKAEGRAEGEAIGETRGAEKRSKEIYERLIAGNMPPEQARAIAFG